MKCSLIASALMLAFGTAGAATFNVTRFDDPVQDGCTVNGCSLNEAVAAANASVGEDQVNLPAGVYSLGTQVLINDDLRIQGAGMATTRIEDAARVFWIRDSTVALIDLALVGGGSGGFPGVEGGAIYAENTDLRLERMRIADVTLSGVAFGAALYAKDSSIEIRAGVIENNYSTFNGGGLALTRSTLSLTRGTKLRGNRAQRGGALWLQGTGTATSYVTADADVQISSNVATNEGGAIWAEDLSLRTTADGAAGERMLLVSQSSSGGKGSAVYASGRATMERVKVYAGSSGGDGAIYAAAATLTDVYLDSHKTDGIGTLVLAGTAGKSVLERVGFKGNYSTSSSGAGGLVNLAGSAFLTNVDFYGNSSAASRVIDNGGDLTLRHVTLHRDPTATLPVALYQRGTGSAKLGNTVVGGSCGGTLSRISSLGGNQRVTVGFLTPICPLTLISDRPAVAASQLGLTYANHGGYFPSTGISNSGSPLIDRGLAAQCVGFDVRRATRDVRCDIGAFEYGAVAP